jgi:hypothetical protein
LTSTTHTASTITRLKACVKTIASPRVKLAVSKGRLTKPHTNNSCIEYTRIEKPAAGQKGRRRQRRRTRRSLLPSEATHPERVFWLGMSEMGTHQN